MQAQTVQIATNKLAFMSVEDLERLDAMEGIDSVSRLVRDAEAEECQLDA